jgi:hypothetical protein
MASQIDHIIVAVTAAQHEELSARLRAAGFVHGDAGKHPGGTANENVAFAGGAFLELLYEQSPGSAVRAGSPRIWFADTPRVQGIGFSTPDYRRDIAAWGSPPGSWDEYFPKVLADGETSQCRAAGPLRRDEFYLFFMDRPAPSFGSLGATARLTGITLRGADYLLWRSRLRTWFGLAEADGASGAAGADGAARADAGPGGLACGDVRFSFEPGEHPAIRLSLAFEVPPGHAATIPISGGVIELTDAGPASGGAS